MTIPQELAFSISKFETRLARVREQMADRRVDLLMLFSPSNQSTTCRAFTTTTIGMFRPSSSL